MGKMIFDNSEFADTSLVSVTPQHRNVIAPNKDDRGLVTTQGMSSNGGTDLMGSMLLSGVENIAQVADRALALIPDIFKSIETMVVECQHTKQVQALVKGQVGLAKQETKRISIQEIENTKRALGEYRRDIQIKELELKQFKEDLLHKEKIAKMHHDEYMCMLDKLEKNAKPLMDCSNALRELIPTVISDDNKLQLLLTTMNTTHHDLVEIAKQLAILRNGGSVND